DLIARGGAATPDHIKIDVDGHEHRVLAGLRTTLPSVRSVWIEMTGAGDASGENARIAALLGECGFAARELPSGRHGRNRLYLNANAGQRRGRTVETQPKKPVIAGA